MKKFIALSAALLFLCSAPTVANGAHSHAKATSGCYYNGCSGWVYICGNGVRIRQGASLRSKIIAKENWYYKKHRSFQCLGIVNGFYQINYHGRVAYVSTEYATHYNPY
ncbi:MAG: SH3 domain-containing protein [Muribaculaceae bacterium]|nr:SH3 domain-containing protein [Muribaculaceae bacterium]